ncbi:DinB family protein [Rossellomorea marisflavi]|nr:DinB family protein [Rossellomorea marisflavi]QHA34416.1 DinB family protein [Rossellomorea marisflavi]
MNQSLYSQFQLTRAQLLNEIKDLKADVIDVQPEGLNNTIHWHIGHVLTVTEQFMFGFDSLGNVLPARYAELFGYGSKPADWSGDVPSVEELSSQLQDQLVRINELSDEHLAQPLEQPFHGLKTFGELAHLSLSHESQHLGQMHAIKLLAERTIVNG